MIDVRDLNYTYQGANKKTIDKVSFNISKGEIFGFLGPSGAGKTTTQRLIIGLLRHYEGTIKVMDKERSNWGKEYFEKIGVAFDFPNLYIKLTAEENLKLVNSYYKKKANNIDELLDRVGLLKDKNNKVESYSKGMKMRLNFIRVLIHDPDILFFDEPTSGLDPVNAKIIKDIILEMKSMGKTIFLTTHNMTVAEQLCDRVAFIIDGQIPIIDSPDSLKKKYGSDNVKIEYFENEILKQADIPLDSLGCNKEFEWIIKNNKIRTIHSQEATLEDIFIKVTGKELIG